MTNSFLSCSSSLFVAGKIGLSPFHAVCCSTGLCYVPTVLLTWAVLCYYCVAHLGCAVLLLCCSTGLCFVFTMLLNWAVLCSYCVAHLCCAVFLLCFSPGLCCVLTVLLTWVVLCFYCVAHLGEKHRKATFVPSGARVCRVSIPIANPHHKT